MIATRLRAASGIRMPACVRWIRRHSTSLSLAISGAAFGAVPGRFLITLISGAFS